MHALDNQVPAVGADHFRSIFLHAQDAIFLLDVESDRIVEANPRAAAILGYDREQLLQTPISAIHPDEMERLARFADTVVQSGTGWTDELSCTTSSRAVLPAEISASVVDVHGRRLILAMVRDITARRLQEAERRSLLEREREAREEAEHRRELLERVEQSRARLIRGFTHDVKNPLGAADGRLQLINEGLMGPVSDDQRGAIEKARRSLRSALDLIDDLIEVARGEAGRIEITAGAMSVEPLVAEMVEEYRGRAETRGLWLTVREGADLPLVDSDPRRLRQVLGNLLSNAIKYTPQGGHVEVLAGGCDRDGSGPGEWVCITVRDDGPGIPLESQELLFREFSRLEPGTTDGAGLGLAISHSIATALGGDLTVRSAPGDGSAFTLWVPTCLQRENQRRD
jgi:PAS domain S-box-containing protein